MGGGLIATHYEAIGFNADSIEGLEEQVEAALPSAKHVPVAEGMDFAVWEDASGASLWVQSVDGTVVGAHPFFAPAEPQTVRVEGAEADPESRMDGQALFNMTPGEDVPRGQEVLLPVDVVNWPLVEASLRPRTMVSARIAAFAESLEAFGSPEEYATAHPENSDRGSQWVVATGLYPLVQGGTGRSTAMLAGIVRSPELRVNGITGAPFLTFRLESAGVSLDVVAPPETEPVEGGIAQGHFWLAALVEPVTPAS